MTNREDEPTSGCCPHRCEDAEVHHDLCPWRVIARVLEAHLAA